MRSKGLKPWDGNFTLGLKCLWQSAFLCVPKGMQGFIGIDEIILLS
jgi:hypothetical protein